MLLVVGLSLLAAFLFALAASLQHHEAHKVTRAVERQKFLLALAQKLPRSRLWLAGWAVNLAGFAAQATALYFGSVAVVQVVLVTQLIFALPLATLWARQWPNGLAWLSGATICTGVVVFVAVYGDSARHAEADRPAMVAALLATAAAVGVLIRLAALLGAATLAIAAGLCFAASAALMKLTAEDLVVRGVAATAADWPGYTLAVSAFAGVVLGQWAFATGALPTVVAATTITNPVASYLIGIAVFQGSPATTPLGLAGVVAAGALISAGVVGLAHTDDPVKTAR